MKILLLGEFSGLHKELKAALVRAGNDVTLASAGDFYKQFPSDIDLGRGRGALSRTARQFIYPFFKRKLLSGFDIVHLVSPYVFPRVIAPNLWLLRFLKDHNDIVTLSGSGDDPFFVKYSGQTMRYSPIEPHEKWDRGGRQHYMRDERHLSGMHRCMEIVDCVIPIMYEYYSTFIAAGYQSKLTQPIPIPIDTGAFAADVDFDSGPLMFFHGLNRPGFKGTPLIREAFRMLSQRYSRDVRCVIAGKMTFQEYMTCLSGAAVSVDQVFSYSLAMNALYSMAMGKVVCGGAESESTILYSGAVPPVFNLKPCVDEIYRVFVTIVSQREGLSQVGIESRQFVERFHDPVEVARRYLECWERLRNARSV